MTSLIGHCPVTSGSNYNACSFLESALHQSQQDSTLNIQEKRLPPPPPPPQFQEPEPFVPPEELEIPRGMEIVSIKGWQSLVTFQLMPPVVYS